MMLIDAERIDGLRKAVKGLNSALGGLGDRLLGSALSVGCPARRGQRPTMRVMGFRVFG